MTTPGQHLPFMNWVQCLRLFILCILLPCGAPARELEAVSFSEASTAWFLPVREIADQLHWQIGFNAAGQCITLNNLATLPGAFQLLADGTQMADQTLVGRAGADITTLDGGSRYLVRSGFRSFTLIIPAKRVHISLGDQELQAWQGSRLVLRTRISSGRHGSTPAGNFQAGPFKARMHYSSRYHNAPMPWSVQVNGHIFIHGFTSVPNYPASHGCIRVPLTGNNPARWFYQWVDRGTPVRIIEGQIAPSV